MLIVCPNCATSYQVETSSLGATGRSVRCVRCRNVWFARDTSARPAIAQAHRSDLQALAASIAAVARGEAAPGVPRVDDPADEPPAFEPAHEVEPEAAGATSFASYESAADNGNPSAF